MKWAVHVTGNKQLNAQLDRFAREAKERQKLARRMGGYVRTLSRQNIKRQRTVDGAAMTPAQKRRAARPMLMGLHSQMVVRAAEGNKGVTVIFGSSRSWVARSASCSASHASTRESRVGPSYG